MTDSPRERRAVRTRQAIIDAAIQIISRQGMEKFSLRKVARHIDYSPAGLYEYFGSVDEIVEAVCQYANERLTAYVKRVPQDLPPAERIVESLLAYIQYAVDYPNLFVLNFTQIINGLAGADIEPFSGDLYDLADEDDALWIFIQAVQQAAQAGVLYVASENDVLPTAYSLWAHAHGMAMLQVAYLPQMPFDYETTHRRALAALVRGLGTPA